MRELKNMPSTEITKDLNLFFKLAHEKDKRWAKIRRTQHFICECLEGHIIEVGMYCNKASQPFG